MRKLVRQVQDAAVYLVRLVLGVIAGFAVLAPASVMFGQWGWILGWLTLSPTFSFFAIVIHEFGHAVGAWSAGMRVNRIVVMGLAWSPITRKWSNAKRPPDASDLGGWVEASEGRRYLTRMGETLYTIGGPAANVVTGILCLILSNLPLPHAAGVLLGGFGVFSFVLAITNLIPWRLNRAPSDGLSLWRIWRPIPRRKPSKPSRSGWRRTPDF